MHALLSTHAEWVAVLPLLDRTGSRGNLGVDHLQCMRGEGGGLDADGELGRETGVTKPSETGGFEQAWRRC